MFKILVVEDDREMNRTVCAFLNNSGYEATSCLSASEGYDAIGNCLGICHIPDLQLCDKKGKE